MSSRYIAHCQAICVCFHSALGLSPISIGAALAPRAASIATMQLQLQTTTSICRLQALKNNAASCSSVKLQAASPTVAEPATAAAAPSSCRTAEDGLEEIYIGFAKGDYGPREGRKGRVIRDNPAKYPGKDNMGLLQGISGGWAGGEAGLWQLREQVVREKAAKKAAVAKSGQPAGSAPLKPPAPKGGLQPIYVGYSKDELEQRKAGLPGRFVVDDPKKYPRKDDVGLFRECNPLCSADAFVLLVA
eukprot:GHRR01011206.1.p1 GENE.GHRR01011206.1~~GHRR01011206.1.p1  ORF type:complete len:246 (+),score=79.20 GHRR01011206.1:2-739(+)